jgi:hypothetical protein
MMRSLFILTNNLTFNPCFFNIKSLEVGDILLTHTHTHTHTHTFRMYVRAYTIIYNSKILCRAVRNFCERLCFFYNTINKKNDNNNESDFKFNYN